MSLCLRRRAPVSKTGSGRARFREAGKGRFIRRRSPQDESSFVFEHGLLHEVVYRGVPLQSRRAWHGRAALWLDQEVASKRHTDRTRIARHLPLLETLSGQQLLGLKRVGRVMMRLHRARRDSHMRKRFDFTSCISLLTVDMQVEARCNRAVAFAAGDLERADSAQEEAVHRTSKSTPLLKAKRMELRARISEARGHLGARETWCQRSLEPLTAMSPMKRT